MVNLLNVMIVSLNFDPVKEIILKYNVRFIFKGAVSGLRYLFATESPLKLMKNAFCFTSKGLFVLKIFNFFS